MAMDLVASARLHWQDCLAQQSAQAGPSSIQPHLNHLIVERRKQESQLSDALELLHQSLTEAAAHRQDQKAWSICSSSLAEVAPRIAALASDNARFPRGAHASSRAADDQLRATLKRHWQLFERSVACELLTEQQLEASRGAHLPVIPLLRSLSAVDELELEDLARSAAEHALAQAMQHLLQHHPSIRARRTRRAPTDESIYHQARLAAAKHAVKQCTARVKQYMRSSNKNFLATIESELAEVATDMLREARISQLFDILTRFPASTPALSDLRDVLRTTEHKEDVWLDLSLSLQDRLLHPGAPTAQIVQLYVYLIRGLRIVDSSGLILSHVIGEVRRYLRARPDTINVLISALLGTDERFAMLREDMGLGESGQTNEDDDNSQLIPHVSRAPAKDALVGATLAASALNQMPKNWSDPNWEPRPINAGPDYRLGTSYDVVQMLVGIFEDRSRFVNALEVSTAKGLLDVKGYDTVKQLETNLILKRRFGDVLLSRCDTMLDDVVNSKRTDSNIHANILPPVASRDHFGRLMPNPSPRTSSFSEPVEPTTHVTHPLIYSRQFWPDLERGPQSVTMGSAQQGNDSQVPHIPLPPSGLSLLTFPPESVLGKSLETYGTAYKKAKTMRKVQWLNSRATVDLSLEMDDGRRIEIEAVDVLYAATIEWVASLAGTSTALTLSNLGLALGVDHAAAEKAVRFWCDRCILREGRDAGEISEDTFVVVENVDASEEGANV